MIRFLRSLICSVFFHKLVIIKNFKKHSRCLYCKRCERYFAMNDEMRVFLPWDSEFTDFYEYEPRYDRER